MGANSLFWYVAFAGSGAVLVFVGLLAEQLAEKAWFKNVKWFRRWKIIKTAGEWAVIGGVFVEIGVAVISAIDEWENNPRNQLISNISAIADIELKGQDTNEIDPHAHIFPKGGMAWIAMISLFDSNTNSVALYPGLLVSDEFNRVPSWTTERGWNTVYSLRFQLESSGLAGTRKLVSEMKRVKIVRIDALFLSPHCSVTWGHVVISANDVQESFEVCPQNHPNPDFTGSGISVFATNRP
jgi:hypothetical protein